VPPADNSRPLVFLAGGVGITPIMSMLRTFRDAGDERPCTLLYAATNWEGMLFADEIARLADDLNLRFVPILLDPAQAPGGEQGPFAADHLDRHVPRELLGGAEFYICGPPPLMDLATRLLRDRRVPAPHIHSERFDLV
jgi:ferredoxin-NADP reductase